MAEILSSSLLHAVRWAVDKQRMMLAADEVLCDLERYRSTVEMVATIANPTPGLREVAACLESQIAERERVQMRARAVLSDGDDDAKNISSTLLLTTTNG